MSTRFSGCICVEVGACSDKNALQAPPKILIALGGKVYDVTSSATFYGPGTRRPVASGRQFRTNSDHVEGQSYHLFAGEDATRGLGMANLDKAAVRVRPGHSS
jgi:predicted heme/steroid binding protein